MIQNDDNVSCGSSVNNRSSSFYVEEGRSNSNSKCSEHTNSDPGFEIIDDQSNSSQLMKDQQAYVNKVATLYNQDAILKIIHQYRAEAVDDINNEYKYL